MNDHDHLQLHVLYHNVVFIYFIQYRVQYRLQETMSLRRERILL